MADPHGAASVPKASQRVPAALRLAADEAVLPAGCTLAENGRPGRFCYLLLSGAALVEAEGQQSRALEPGSLIWAENEAGRPLPPDGVTVRLTRPSLVAVFDPTRLTALLGVDAAARAAWHSLRAGN